jgi:glycosyltransferase involved in cell wall biosynthesis
MKRVLVIAPYPYLPFFSGGQKTIAQFNEYLAQEVSLTVVSTKTNDARLVKGYTLLQWLPDSFLRYVDIRLIGRLSQLIRAERFDCIIWIHPYYHWLARLIQRKFNLFTIVHSHNVEYQRFRSTGKWWWPILRMYEKACLRSVDYNYFISQQDLETASKEWQLDQNNCDVMPLGITQREHPTDRSYCRQIIRERYGLGEKEHILLFNGLLNYPPNQQALDDLLNHINPKLQLKQGFSYRLIICGKNLPSKYAELAAYRSQRVIYAGFVPDIETYFKAADVFLNPVLSGGGIKTKMVEAIGLGTPVVSSLTGSAGIDPAVCGDKLIITADNDWDMFSSKVVEACNQHHQTPDTYYQKYYWGNIIQKIPALLANQPTR